MKIHALALIAASMAACSLGAATATERYADAVAADAQTNAQNYADARIASATGGLIRVESDPVWNAEKGGYQQKIDDLGAIREGAAKGATALQEHQSLEPATNYTDAAITALDAALRAEITAHTPGNYETVSNRAMTALQEHQSLAPATNYTDAVVGAAATAGTNYTATVTADMETQTHAAETYQPIGDYVESSSSLGGSLPWWGWDADKQKNVLGVAMHRGKEITDFEDFVFKGDQNSWFAAQAFFAGIFSYYADDLETVTLSSAEVPNFAILQREIRKGTNTLDTTLRAEIAAHAPGNYAAVSNAAMWASNKVSQIHIDATDPTFSNAVLAVGMKSDTVVIGADAAITNIAPGYSMPTNHSIAIGALAKTTLPTTTSRTSARQIDSRAVAIGYNAEASGTYGAAQSVAIGPNTKASGAASVALGGGSCDYDDSGVITNTEATAATGDFGLAIGYRAKAQGNYSTALGYKTTTEGGNSVAVGGNTTIAKVNSTAIGFDAASASSSVAIGTKAGAANLSVAIGSASLSTNYNSVAIGANATNLNVRSLALGSNAATTMNDGIAIGTASSTEAAYATAIGYESDAHGTQSIIIGTRAASGGSASYSIGIGEQAAVSNSQGIAIGRKAVAVGQNDIVIGNNAKSSGNVNGNAVAIGNGADARNVHNIAIGLGAIARQPGAIAIGNNYGGGGATDSYGYYSLAVGNGAKASQESSVAIGTKAVNAKAKSVQLGEGTTSSTNSLQFRSVPLVTEAANGVGKLNNNLQFVNTAGKMVSLKDLGVQARVGGHHVYADSTDGKFLIRFTDGTTTPLQAGVLYEHVYSIMESSHMPLVRVEFNNTDRYIRAGGKNYFFENPNSHIMLAFALGEAECVISASLHLSVIEDD